MRKIIAGLLILLAFPLIAAVVVWSFPSLLINSTSLRWMKSQLESEFRQIDWASAKIKASSQGFFSKSLEFEANDLVYADQSLRASSQRLDLHFSLHLDVSEIERIVVHRLIVSKLRIKINSETKDESSGAGQGDSGSSPLSFLKWIKLLELEAVKLHLDELSIQNPDSVLHAEGRVLKEDDSIHSSARFDYTTASSEKFSGQLDLSSSATLSSVEDLQLQANLQTPTETYLLSGNYEEARSDGPLQLKLQLKKRGLIFTSTGSLHFTEGGLDWPQSLKLIRSSAKQTISLSPLKLSLDWNEEIKLNAVSDWSITGWRDGLDARMQSIFTQAIEGSLNLESLYNTDTETLATSLDVKALPLDEEALRAEASLQLEFETNKNAFVDKLRGAVDVDAEFFDFQNLVALLKTFDLFVPAPFHVLNGPLNFHLNSDFQEETELIPFNYSLTTDLKSKEQILNLEISGDFSLKREANTIELNSIKADLLAKDVVLVWPDLGLKPPPKLTPDKRFKTKVSAPEPKEENWQPETKFDYLVNFKTPTKPIRIRFPFSSEPLRIYVDALFGSEQRTDGQIKLDPVELEVFRRTAHVQSASIELKPKISESDLNVRMEVRYSEYTISIQLKGAVSAPLLILESNPPLSREDIIAVLLFGRPLEALDFEDGNSVANAEAALVDQSLTLASMFFLASTPVESISYNPETEQFQARFRLPGGLSLSVGSDTEKLTELGLIKRLGHGFRVRTEVKEMMDKDKEAHITAFLEWLFRY